MSKHVKLSYNDYFEKFSTNILIP